MSTSTLTFSDGAGDCWADAIGSFDKTGANLWIGATDVGDRDPRDWIPFVVTLQRGIVVASATLKITADRASSSVTSNIKTGCEAADNPSAPTTKADLFARVMTTANSTVTLVQYVLNTVYSYDVTAAVQEVLNRSGWLAGNTLACMIHDVSTADKPHSVYSFEGGANKPVLEIVINNMIPRSAGMI